MKKSFVWIFFLLILGSGTFLFFPEGSEDPAKSFWQVRIGDTHYRVEVVGKSEERSRGLSGRETLCERCGMLFLFEEPGRYGFWMKDMRFSLDIVWLKGDQVVGIERSVPAASRSVFYPPVPIDRVLEFPGGTLKDLRVGDRVEWLP